MKKYLFPIFIAFFFSGCSDTDEIVREANQRSQAEIDRLVAINKRQEQKLERIKKAYYKKFNPPTYCLLVYTLKNIKTNEISTKYITDQNINDYVTLRSKMIGDVYEDEKQILDIDCICAMGLYFLKDIKDNTIWSYLVSGVSEPELGMITPSTPVAIKLIEMEKYDTIEIPMLDKKYQLIDKILQIPKF